MLCDFKGLFQGYDIHVLLEYYAVQAHFRFRNRSLDLIVAIGSCIEPASKGHGLLSEHFVSVQPNSSEHCIFLLFPVF